jgi:hypothetical protein
MWRNRRKLIYVLVTGATNHTFTFQAPEVACSSNLGATGDIYDV